MFKKKKENLSEEYLRNKDPLGYCLKTYKCGQIINNSEVINSKIINFEICEFFSIKKERGSSILIYFYRNKDQYLENRHYQVYTLYNPSNKKFAKIIYKNNNNNK